jgi:hypothetical protein
MDVFDGVVGGVPAAGAAMSFRIKEIIFTA